MASSRDPVPTAMPLEGQARALLRSHPGVTHEISLRSSSEIMR
jgi:hypothetical protein